MSGNINSLGMMLTLKKRMSISRPDNDGSSKEDWETKELPSQFLVLGNYDGLDISNVETWYGMRPGSVEKKDAITSLNDNYLDKYTLKVYFSSSEQGKETSEYFKATRALWDSIGKALDSESKKPAEVPQALMDFPIISLGLINLSPGFVRSINAKGKSNPGIQSDNRLQEDMEECFLRTAHKKNINMEKLHLSIFPCIGYADYVALFLSRDLRDVLCVFDGIKDETDENGNTIVSNCCPMTGIFQQGINTSLIQDMQGVMASIKINLKTGISADAFRKSLSASAGALNLKTEIEKNAYHVFGNADCLLIPQISFASFVLFYFNEGPLDPNSDFFQANIESTHTSLYVKIDETNKDNTDNQGSSNVRDKTEIKRTGEADRHIDKLEKEYRDFIKQLRTYMKENSLPIRSTNALQVVFKRYLNLISYPHCFDIEKILLPAFSVFMENILKSIAQSQEADSEQTKNKIRNQMRISIDRFRERIGSYLADLQSSDRSFMEGQLIMHPSVASATKLLFFYNRFINQFASELVKTEKEKANRSYQFVVISGGNDETLSMDLFNYLEQSDVDLKSLIILSIHEMSLYDVQGTMFRLLHECFHFCGERLRKERYFAFISSISRYVGWELAQLEFNGVLKIAYLDKISKIISENIAEEKQEDVREKIKHIFSNQKKNLQGRIAEHLEELLKTVLDIDSLPSEELYEKEVKYRLKEVLSTLFLTPFDTKEKEKFPRDLYGEILKTCSVFARQGEEVLKEYGIRFSTLTLLGKETQFYLKQMEKGIYDEAEKEYIQCIMQLFSDNLVVLPDDIKIDPKDIPSIDAMVDSIVDAEKEAYCDSIPGHILAINKENFILSFIYEKCAIESAFPATALNTIRVVTELDALYRMKGPLLEHDEKQMKVQLKHWHDCGFDYQVYGGNTEKRLIERINTFMAEAPRNQVDYFIEPLVQHIKSCINYYDTVWPTKFKRERELYSLAQLRDDKSVHQMLKEITFYWSELADR